MTEEIIEQALEYIKKLFQNNSDGHDAAHSIRVYTNARKIAEEYPECDLTVVSLAALLHDADDHKLFDTVNNMNARMLLKDMQVADSVIERICEVINGVSFSQNRGKRPSTLEGQIVQDADRLDAMGAIGIARTFAYGGKVGRPLEDSLRHFDDKLLLLKDEMNTEVAKKIAEHRHKYMEEFLAELHDETDF